MTSFLFAVIYINMKNFIFKHYNIIVDKIYSKNNRHYFFIKDDKIYIIKYKNNEKRLYNLYILTNYLYHRGIFVNTFIINSDNNYYTKYEDCYIILLKANNNEVDVELFDIQKFFNINSYLEDYNIIKEWENEIDIIERELIEYNNEYPFIQNSIDFFIGLGENAISLLNNYEHLIKSNNDSIGHKLSFKMFEDNSLYDPLLFIKTNKMYDVSNFIKYKFFINDLNYDEINVIMKSLTEYEELFLFSSLMYPCFYFDLVKKVLLKEESEEKIKRYINSIDKYVYLLLFCKNNMKNIGEIKSINWIK